MALMTVNDEGSADFRSKNRWSASKKLDVVVRLSWHREVKPTPEVRVATAGIRPGFRRSDEEF
jgi:hypothetical protein